MELDENGIPVGFPELPDGVTAGLLLVDNGSSEGSTCCILMRKDEIQEDFQAVQVLMAMQRTIVEAIENLYAHIVRKKEEERAAEEKIN